MSYGLVYGLSAFGLSKQLRIDQTEAKQLMMEYFARFGAVRDYLRSSVQQAKIDGYTETIFGRRRPFPDLASPNRVLRENAERAALNAPIQGSAADIMKIALFHIHDEFAREGLDSRVLMQIHDELVVEVAPGEWDAAERIVRERIAEQRHGHRKWVGFAIGMARAWTNYRPITVRLTLDGVEMVRRTPFVFIGNALSANQQHQQ
jgi:DNA polymerase-1